MLMQFKSVIVCAAMVAIAVPTIQGQECSTCSTDSTFGYPVAASGCAGGGCGSRLGGHREELRESLDQTRQRNALVYQRNDAWPKPFSCIDRQLYEGVWQPFVDAGYERQCVLSTSHFDAETGELNDFGKTMVAGMIQNMPESRKVVYVHRESDQQRSQQRLDNVRNSVQDMFGHMTTARVAFSDQVPFRASALRIERLNELGFEQTPTPIIPIATGRESLNASVGQ